MVELTKIMRQKGDDKFIEVLNKVRVGNINDFVDNIFNSRLTLTNQILVLITYFKYMLRLNQQIFIIRKCLAGLIQDWF